MYYLGLFTATCLALYLLIVGLAYFNQHSLVYHPDRQIVQTPDEIGLNYEDLYIPTSNSRTLNAWLVRADHQTEKTVLFCHGNAGNIYGRLETIALFNNLGVNIIVFDYQGYGKSTGSPGEAETYQDVLSVYTYLIREKQLSADSLIVMGRSLGGAIAAWLATQQKVAGLILDSTFTSFEAVAKHAYPFLPVSMLLQFRYPTEEYIKKITAPVLIAHSRDDELIPYKLGKELFEISDEPKSFLKMRGPHSGAFLTTGQSYKHGMNAFIQDVTN